MEQDKKMRYAVLFGVVVLFVCLAVLVLGVHQARMAASPEPLKGESYGMMLIEISDQEAAAFYHVDRLGVYVLAVDEASKAYLSGVRSGDCLMSVSQINVSTINEFTNACDTGSSNPMEMVFMHGSDKETFTVWIDAEQGTFE